MEVSVWQFSKLSNENWQFLIWGFVLLMGF